MIKIPIIQGEWGGVWLTVSVDAISSCVLQALCSTTGENAFIRYITYAMTDQESKLKSEDELALQQFYNALKNNMQ